MPLDHQELCELADREIRLGTVDEALMTRAHKEANGVTVRAHQIYWRLRAVAIQEEAQRISGESYVRDLRARLDAEDKRRKLRREFVGWMWVLLCFVSLVGT